MKPCIVAVGYNRPECLSRLLKSISEAIYNFRDITLVISLDKADDDNGCFEIAEQFKWNYGEKIINTHQQRLGLRKHILECGDLSQKYGSVIILEDDLLVSPMFYSYACGALEVYKNDSRITGISLYSHEWNGYANKFFSPILDGNDVYMGQYSITWGECWTKEWWNNFKKWYLENQILDKNNEKLPTNINNWPESSWGKYFITYMVEKNLFYIIPRFSLSTNCSFPGQHVKTVDTSHQVRLLETNDYNFKFSDSSKLLKYDIFFENIDLKTVLEKQLNSCVTINLTSKNRKYSTRYVLTTKRIPFKVVESFGLELRPIELNILKNIQGYSIFLYDLNKKSRKPKNNHLAVLRYEFRGAKLKDIFKYFFLLLFNKIRSRL